MARHMLYAATAAALIAPVLLSGAATAPATAANATVGSGGIQWFTRLKDGLAEARRTGRPILFVSAAPSCGGVPGTW